MLVACVGDVMLDVIVETEHGLRDDDDIPAVITLSAGGQAANVASWVVALGGRARVQGPRVPLSDSGPGRLVEASLTARGVELCGAPPAGGGRTGAVVSVVTGGSRSMASDPGDVRWLDELAPGPWLEGADWLFVSGYALLRARHPQRVVATAATAREHGAQVAVDLSSAAMLGEYGADAFSRLCGSLRPAVVFATDEEWSTAPGGFGAGGDTVLVLKHGAAGASFVIDGIADERAVRQGVVMDTTGAGDALAAGYLVGGVELAMAAAARCVAHRGAQPPRAAS